MLSFGSLVRQLLAEQLKSQGYVEKNSTKKRLVWLLTCFSATKVRWILDHVGGSARKSWKGELLFGTIDTWLVWKLTDGAAHVTDYSNAARTMLYNIKDLKWDDEILEILNIQKPCFQKFVLTQKSMKTAAIPFLRWRSSNLWYGWVTSRQLSLDS